MGEQLELQVLLEIALNQRINNDVEKSLSAILQLYLRKLNCFAVAVYRKESWSHVRPNALAYNKDCKTQLATFSSFIKSSDGKAFSKCINGILFYAYPLSAYGWLVLIKKTAIADTLFYELNKVVTQLGKDIVHTQEEERLKILQGLFDKSSDGIEIFDENGQFYYMNEVASHRYGISKDDLSAQDAIALQRLITYEDEDWSAHIKMLKAQEERVIERSFIHPASEEIHTLEITEKIITVKEKDFVIALSRDVTERKQQEQRLKTSKQKIESIFNEMTEVVYSIKLPEKEVLFVTPSAKSIFEIPSTAFLDNFDLWSDYLVEEDRPVLKQMKQKLAKRGAFNLKYRIITPSGQLKWIRNRAKYIYDSAGNPVRLDGVILDRTEQYAAKERLDKEVKLQEVLIDIASQFINLDAKDADHVINNALETMGLFVAADRAYIFDYDFENETTSNTYEWCNTGVQPEIDNLQEVPIAYVPQWVEQHKQGKAFYIPDIGALDDEKDAGLKEILEPQGIKSLIAIPMHDQEELIGFVGFDSVKQHYQYTEREKKILFLFGLMLINIRNRKKWDEQLKIQNEQLRNFSYIAAHNLRSHSSGLTGVLDVLKLEHPDFAKNEIVHLLDSSILNLQDTVHYLTESTKIRLSQVETTAEYFSKYLEKNIQSLKMQIQEADFKIINEIDADLKVKGTPAYLDSLALNMLTNAIKYRNRERSSYLKIYAKESHSRVIIYFEDNGLGIDMKRHGDKVFGMFKKFHTNKDAMGIGLFMTKTQIESIGGTITVDSEVNVGTTFKIALAK